jgi:TusE/DsrC/DsvC family sulfur relay protein
MPEIVQDHSQEHSVMAVDDDGFLMNMEDWTEEVAGVLAEREGIEHLSGDQLDILKYLRSYYREHAFFPIVRSVCSDVRQPRTCVTDRFPDPVTAWKIAGLPNPGGEVIGFRSWEPLGY